MEVVFVRHAEPNYEEIKKHHFKGQGYDIAPLTDNGVFQTIEIANNPLFKDCELIITSPYTRTLQTAAILSHKIGVKLLVEFDLHDILTEHSFSQPNDDLLLNIDQEFLLNKGEHNDSCKYYWESLSTVSSRVQNVLDKYSNYQKIIIVTHKIVIKQFFESQQIPYCFVGKINYSKNYSTLGFLEREHLT